MGQPPEKARIDVEVVGLGNVRALRLRSPEQRRAVVVRAYYNVLNEDTEFHQEFRRLVDTHREDLRRHGSVPSKIQSAVTTFASHWTLPVGRGAKDILWSAQLAARLQRTRYHLYLGPFPVSEVDLKRVSPHRLNRRELRFQALRVRRRIKGWTYAKIADAEIREGGDADGVYEESIRLTVDAWAKELDIRIPKRPRWRPQEVRI